MSIAGWIKNGGTNPSFFIYCEFDNNAIGYEASTGGGNWHIFFGCVFHDNTDHDINFTVAPKTLVLVGCQFRDTTNAMVETNSLSLTGSPSTWPIIANLFYGSGGYALQISGAGQLSSAHHNAQDDLTSGFSNSAGDQNTINLTADPHA
jgi:hypothetical protein